MAWSAQGEAGSIGSMTLMFAWSDTSGMSREEADRMLALMCSAQLHGITLDNATGWTSPSHRVERDAEKFAEWLGKGGTRETETRRRALLAATDLARTPGKREPDQDDVLTAAKWMTGFVTGSDK